mmetsp:Transcript_1688/g.3701  ORF Transcript_1688/g.3701 Transcript_1688/m.3701 type:complete len:96 (-) Transcript_1688:1441-1728(-)
MKCCSDIFLGLPRHASSLEMNKSIVKMQDCRLGYQFSLVRLGARDCNSGRGTPRIPLSVIINNAVPLGLCGDLTSVHVRTSSMLCGIVDVDVPAL